jgi:hypothetical protein
MKILFEDYTFNAAAKQITFNTTSVVGLEQLLVITNVTDNIIIYNFADPSAGGTVANNVLTLDYDTTSMSNTDNLQIFLDNLESPASDEMLRLMGRMVKLLEPSAVQDVGGRQRVSVDVFNPQLMVNPSYILNPTYAPTQTGLPGGGMAAVAESAFNLQSRIAYIALRQNLEFS